MIFQELWRPLFERRWRCVHGQRVVILFDGGDEGQGGFVASGSDRVESSTVDPMGKIGKRGEVR